MEKFSKSNQMVSLKYFLEEKWCLTYTVRVVLFFYRLYIKKGWRDLWLDSLDLLELVTDSEDLFNIRFDDDELVAFKTVGDVVRSAMEKM